MPNDNDDAEYDKIIGQFRGVLNKLLWPLRMYGQGKYVEDVIPELVSLGVQLHMKLNGIDIPYDVRDLHW